MAVEKSALRVTELDFDSIRENLKTFLRSQSEFQDFDFEGSGMSVLLDILAYNTHYMGYYLNMVGNEMFLDTAQLRNSIISHAKLMNYVPASKQGALSKINIKVTPSTSEDQATTTITLDKYTRLIGSDIDGINYPFVTLYSNTASKVSGSFNFANVFIKQGEVVTLQYLMEPTNEQRRFEIPSANVDTQTLLVNVQDSVSNTDTITYTLAEDITTLNSNSTVYFVEENENLNYTVYFGDNVIGKRPKDGSVIIVTYIDNDGSVANNISRFVFAEDIANKYSDNVIVTATQSSYGGTEKETIDQVRFRAPYFYSTQNRAVTKLDYETLVLKDYTNIDSVAVWGGEENDPIVYGKMFLSLKTRGNYALTNLEKEQIKTELIRTRNVLTVTPEIVDPDYTYLMVEGRVFYDPKLTTRTAGELNTLVRAAIQDYNDAELNQFNSTFRKSRLQYYIENCEKSITGSDIKVFMQKRFDVDTTQRKAYTINFNAHIQHNDEDNLSTFPTIQIFDASNVLRNAYLEETPDVATGIYSISVTEGGRNYTVPPTVTITGDGSGATAVARILSGRVTSVEVTNPGINYTYAVVTLTGGDGTGASATLKLESDIGTLRSFYYKSSGEKTIINDNVGFIDHPTGIITINSIRIFDVVENDFYDDGILTITAMARDANLYPLRNRILSIDENDPRSIQIDMVVG